MAEEHKEENEELKEEDREKQDKTTQEQVEAEAQRERGRETERKTEAALRLFQTMTGNVAKDSHIVQQDTVQYIESITDNSVLSK